MDPISLAAFYDEPQKIGADFAEQKTAGKDWKGVLKAVAGMPAHAKVRIPKAGIEHPVEAGFSRGLGFPRGQKADYRLKKDNVSFHIRDHGDEYVVHRDRVHPKGVLGTIGHFFADLPQLAIPSAAAAIGVPGVVVAKKVTHGD